eukprot:106382-Pelagomonas_calceolata.AAC.1
MRKLFQKDTAVHKLMKKPVKPPVPLLFLSRPGGIIATAYSTILLLPTMTLWPVGGTGGTQHQPQPLHPISRLVTLVSSSQIRDTSIL